MSLQRFLIFLDLDISRIVPILLFMMFVVKAYKKPEENVEVSKQGEIEEKEVQTSKITWVIVPMTLCLATINTLEIVYFNLGATFLQYSELKPSASESASIICAMTAAY